MPISPSEPPSLLLLSLSTNSLFTPYPSAPLLTLYPPVALLFLPSFPSAPTPPPSLCTPSASVLDPSAPLLLPSSIPQHPFSSCLLSFSTPSHPIYPSTPSLLTLPPSIAQHPFFNPLPPFSSYPLPSSTPSHLALYPPQIPSGHLLSSLIATLLLPPSVPPAPPSLLAISPLAPSFLPPLCLSNPFSPSFPSAPSHLHSLALSTPMYFRHLSPQHSLASSPVPQHSFSPILSLSALLCLNTTLSPPYPSAPSILSRPHCTKTVASPPISGRQTT